MKSSFRSMGSGLRPADSGIWSIESGLQCLGCGFCRVSSGFASYRRGFRRVRSGFVSFSWCFECLISGSRLLGCFEARNYAGAAQACRQGGGQFGNDTMTIIEERI